MHDVFISYSHRDDEPDESVDHEIDRPVERFRRLYLKHLKDQSIDGDGLFYFDDREPAGENIGDSVRQAIESCSVMLAFFSPNYFNSEFCRQEFLAFQKSKAEAESRGERKLLIPMELRKVDPGFKSRLSGPGVGEWLQELTTAQGSRHGAKSEELLDVHSGPLARRIERLAKEIGERVRASHKIPPGFDAAENILVIESPIEHHTLRGNVEIAQKLLEAQLKYSLIKPVAVIYAGGTVGMVHQSGSDPIHADFEMAASVEDIVSRLRPTFKDLPFNIHFFRLAQTLDSSNVRAADWVALAKLTRELESNYQGIVFLHGTNTICYTASALSFLLNDTINNPVILTGSEIPISVNNTDAVHNIENAVRAAAHEAYNGPLVIPEVCIYWANKLLRGNRTAKRVASDRQHSFHTPNLALPLASLTHEKLEVEHTLVHRRQGSDDGVPSLSDFPDLSSVRVEVMFIYPEMQFDDLEDRYPNSIDGLILLSYGSGNVPEDVRFIDMVRRLITAGCVVVNVTQCPFGRVELKLFETSAVLFDLGVIDGYDMTLECAYTKLLWALASVENRRQPGAREAIRRKFQVAVAGEMSASIHRVDLGGTRTGRFVTTKDGRHSISDVRSLPLLDRYDIMEAYLRLESVQPNTVDKDLEIVIYFGAPPANVGEGEPDMYAQTMLARFRKRLTGEERKRGRFDKNLAITHPFRKNFRNQDFQLSIGSSEGAALNFDGLSLVVYSRTS
jgi:L-asparaginase